MPRKWGTAMPPKMPPGSRWTVIERSPRRDENDRRVRWVCRCLCGTVRDVAATHLRSPQRLSCGCYHKEVASRMSRRHGMSKSREYGVWIALVHRAINPKDRKWRLYGGRGIGVCARWLVFDNFIADMGRRPSPNATIDRIDNDRGYEPGNCRWASYAEQNRNLRTNRVIEYRGERLCLRDWADRIGIRSGVITDRLNRGWAVTDTFTTPVGTHRQHFVTLCGVTLPAAAWAKRNGISRGTATARIRRGWSPERAVTARP